jgi:hypothetical protein
MTMETKIGRRSACPELVQLLPRGTLSCCVTGHRFQAYAGNRSGHDDCRPDPMIAARTPGVTHGQRTPVTSRWRDSGR